MTKEEVVTTLKQKAQDVREALRKLRWQGGGDLFHDHEIGRHQGVIEGYEDSINYINKIDDGRE